MRPCRDPFGRRIDNPDHYTETPVSMAGPNLEWLAGNRWRSPAVSTERDGLHAAGERLWLPPGARRSRRIHPAWRPPWRNSRCTLSWRHRGSNARSGLWSPYSLEKHHHRMTTGFRSHRVRQHPCTGTLNLHGTRSSRPQPRCGHVAFHSVTVGWNEVLRPRLWGVVARQRFISHGVIRDALTGPVSIVRTRIWSAAAGSLFSLPKR